MPRPLLEDALDADPLRQFQSWFAEAGDAGVRAPEAAALATSTVDGRPAARMVLVKQVDERGLAFHTNHGSRKARELTETGRAALLFYWAPPGHPSRQVRVEGTTERTSREESEAYFRTRSRESQVSAWASRQSSELAGREALDAALADATRRFEGADVPLPPHWGGYRVVPEAWEFWQHGEHRSHDRFRYTREPDGRWRRARLAP